MPTDEDEVPPPADVPPVPRVEAEPVPPVPADEHPCRPWKKLVPPPAEVPPVPTVEDVCAKLEDAAPRTCMAANAARLKVFMIFSQWMSSERIGATEGENSADRWLVPDKSYVYSSVHLTFRILFMWRSCTRTLTHVNCLTDRNLIKWFHFDLPSADLRRLGSNRFCHALNRHGSRLIAGAC